MFNENLKKVRKQKGFTQEELAAKLHIVRQTVSKWEKDLSVPDADTLIRLAEILDISVSELLGEKIKDENSADNVAEQLSRINEQLAVKNRRSRRIWKIIAVVLAATILLYILAVGVGCYVPNLYDSPNSNQQTISQETIIEDE